MRIRNCRLCKSEILNQVIDLGQHPLADTFLTKEQLAEPEVYYPLIVLQCENCGYVTSSYLISPEERYQKNEFSYDSSNSPISVKHFSEMADQIIARIDLGKNDLVVDVGSSVGTFLGELRNKSNCRIIGVDPSLNIAKEAEKREIPTINDFFNENSANQILQLGKVKSLTATNVFNHIEGVDDFMRNTSRIVSDDGQVIIEVPYIVDLIEKTAFDTIYLEHVSYFAVKPHARYFREKGFYITHLETNSYMGGSIRVFLSKNEQLENKKLVNEYSEREESLGVYKQKTYELFMDKMKQFKINLCKTIFDAKADGKKVIGIGAATKGNTLLNYCKIDSTVLEYIAESSMLKIGKYTPGSRIKIVHEKEIGSDISFAVILPWNIADFLKSKFSHLGLKFIVPHV